MSKAEKGNGNENITKTMTPRQERTAALLTRAKDPSKGPDIVVLLPGEHQKIQAILENNN